MVRMLLCPILFLVVTSAILDAGQFNEKLDIGEKAPAWKDLVGVDGVTHSLADLDDHDVVIVVFTCNSCPYAVDVEDRLIELDREYSEKGVQVVAINVNRVDEDLLPAMKEKAETKGFKFPYLYDESQKIAREFGAVYTPEFYVLNRSREVVYMGAMDDSPAGDKVTTRYVALAVDAALTGGEPEVTETPPVGCGVRYVRERRSRRSAD